MPNYYSITSRKLYSSIFIFFLIIGVSKAQLGNIEGTVNIGKQKVAYASVFIPGSKHGTYTDSLGNFIINNIPQGEYTLRVESIGMHSQDKSVSVESNQTVFINFHLEEAAEHLDQIVVTGTMKETYIKDSPVKIEVITKEFLQKNPVNNVIEALQTVNGVQEQVNCGVCGTNDIHINGLEGPYTLVLIDGMPIMSALASVYGFNGIPTSLIERIEIIKGPSSTLYGSEAVGGVINIITISPDKLPTLQANSFYTSHREWNLDLAVSPKVFSKATTVLSGNFYRNQYRMDYNNDNFTDIPLNNRFSLFNRWSFARKENRKAEIAFRYYTEDRFGGVMNWQPKYRGSDSVYGESIYTSRLEAIGSYQLPITKTNVRIDYSYNKHHQNSYYGTTQYLADQSIYFTNFIWSDSKGKHDWLLGYTNRFETYTDNSLANINDQRFIPGVFAQDEWKLLKKTSLLAGTRFDYHKKHGIIVSPRLNIKKDIGNYLITRLNLGTGFRNVNLFTEDHAALTGSRTVQILENLNPERSYNANLNLNYSLFTKHSFGGIDLDLFYTYFTNKIIPDYDSDPNLIIYKNLDGSGISRGLSASVQQSFDFPFKIMVGFTFQDVYQITQNDQGEQVRENQVFAPKLSGTFTLSYQIKKHKLSFDYTGKVVGPQALPQYPTAFEKPQNSPWYTIQNIQITKEWKTNLQTYVGVKNILNWTQESPLIDPGNPFGDAFDTSYAWGPLQKRRLFVGIRYKIN